MNKINCPHCGIFIEETKHEKISEHFLCNDCKTLFNTVKKDGAIKVEMQG